MQRRTAKVAGIAGYVVMSVGIVLLVLWLGLIAGEGENSVPLGVVAIATLLVGVGMISYGRMLLVRGPVRVRPQQDPLLPEVTPEDESAYDVRYHPDEPNGHGHLSDGR